MKSSSTELKTLKTFEYYEQISDLAINNIGAPWNRDQPKLLYHIMNKYLIWLLITLGLLGITISLNSCTLVEMIRDQDRARTNAVRLFTPEIEN